MKTELAQLTLFLLIVVAALFVVGILVLVMCAGFKLNPFREKTTSFLLAFFGGLIGLSAILVLLNVATNISIIADSKVANLSLVPQSGSVTKWIPGSLALALAIVSVIFVSTRLRRKKNLQVLRGLADDVVKQNSDLLAQISQKLEAGQSQDYRSISAIRLFLEKQQAGIPDLLIIYAQPFEGRIALYQIGRYHYHSDEDSKPFKHDYYSCTPLDSAYLNNFFSGKDSVILEHYSDDNFSIYVPIAGKESRFALLFSQRKQYGKLGS